MDNVHAYDAHADTINVDDITSDSCNRAILRRLRKNDADDHVTNNGLYIQNHQVRDGGDCIGYVPEGVNDMGWLGYFVGKNNHLEKLAIHSFTPTSGASVRDMLVAFFRGVSRNKSIRTIDLYETDLLRGDLFTMLGPFFKNNHTLTRINIEECDFGDEGGRLLALALGKCTHKSLKTVMLMDNDIIDDGIVDIITALSMHHNLELLDLSGNRLRKNACVALATLLRSSVTQMQTLDISNNEINDDGIEALVPVLTNCNHLEELFLSSNLSITSTVWQSFAAILESPNCNLKILDIANTFNADDDVAASFANVLVNNRTLHVLDLDNNQSITANGWEAFTNLLCDTSSVNATFLSNHTLDYLGREGYANNTIGPLLDLNSRNDKIEVATIKILQNHDDFDMLPFFEWEFKCLPLVLDWLERASAYEMPRNFEPNIDGRKLSTIYQFVKGLPLLYVETRLRKELEDIKAEESQMEDEQLSLDHRKQLAQERKASIMRRLGRH